MQIFNFIVLSVIIAPHDVLTSLISKTHLPIVSFNVRKLEWNDAQNSNQEKKEGPPKHEGGWGGNSTTLAKS